MLKKLGLTNFKAFGDPGLELEPGLITVLIGPNGTGKSSVLQSLGLLKQSLGQATLSLNGRYVILDTYRYVVHQGIENSSIKFSLTVNTFRDEASVHFLYDLALLGRESAVQLNRAWIQYRSTREEFSLNLPWTQETGGISQELHFRGMNFRLASYSDIARPIRITGSATVPQGRQAELERNRELLATIIGSPSWWLSTQFFHVPASRELTLSQYALAGSPQTNLENLQQQPPDPNVASTYLYLQSNRETAAQAIQIESRIFRVTGAKVSPNLRSGPSVSMESAREGLNTSLSLLNEGFGANPLVHMFVQIAEAPKLSTIGIEEPEIHLHPRAQGELARVLAEIATQERKQLILTTHSEHILSSLLTCVASGTLKPEELAIYSFSRDAGTGAAHAERLEVTEEGAVKGGLKGFFEVEWEEVDSYLKAITKRRRSSKARS